MNATFVISLAVLAFIGVYFGGMVARASAKVRPIHGGPLARALHFAACVVMVIGAPAVLMDIFIWRAVSPLIILAAVIASLFVLLLAYAFVEQPARARYQPPEDRGWTAEDAKSSGL